MTDFSEFEVYAEGHRAFAVHKPCGTPVAHGYALSLRTLYTAVETHKCPRYALGREYTVDELW